MNTQALKMLYAEHEIIIKAAERVRSILKEDKLYDKESELNKKIKFLERFFWGRRILKKYNDMTSWRN
mgnify:CR=1 FL=1